MSDVFLLGAGFSKAVSEHMPLLDELSNELLKRVNLPDSLHSFGENVEHWLTYLSQPHPWLSESENLRNRALFLEMTRHMRDILSESTNAAIKQKCPDWLNKFVQWCHEHKVGVITLNYDTLVERAARLIRIRDNEYLSLDNIYPVALTETRRRIHLIFGSSEVGSFKLYKLHGSVNWYYSGATSFYGETIFYSFVESWGAEDKDESKSIKAASDKAPLIVPPTTEKVTYFQHETLRHVWLLAGKAIQSAERLFCIGYSFPETDLSIRFFLHTNRPARKIPVYVVNKDPTAVGRYHTLIGSAYDVKDDYVGDSAIEKLVDNLKGGASD